MDYRITLQQEAIQDIKEAYDWYQSQQAGLGDEWIEQLEMSFLRIANQPLSYTQVNDQLRRMRTSRFPYLIIYEIRHQEILILAVMHTSRKGKFK